MRPGLGQHAGGAFWVKTQLNRVGVSVLPVPHRDGELLLLLFPQVHDLITLILLAATGIYNFYSKLY